MQPCSRLRSFLPGPWQPCSKSCGAGTQQRRLSCRVRLSFSQTVADLPDEECVGPKPAASRPCYGAPCPRRDGGQEAAEPHDWEYQGFSQCSESCGGGKAAPFPHKPKAPGRVT